MVAHALDLLEGGVVVAVLVVDLGLRLLGDHVADVAVDLAADLSDALGIGEAAEGDVAVEVEVAMDDGLMLVKPGAIDGHDGLVEWVCRSATGLADTLLMGEACSGHRGQGMTLDKP